MGFHHCMARTGTRQPVDRHIAPPHVCQFVQHDHPQLLVVEPGQYRPAVTASAAGIPSGPAGEKRRIGQ